jgi:hypothetical protein
MSTQFSPIVVCASRDLHINSGCQKKIPFVEMVTLTLVLDFEDLRDPAMVRWMASQANRDIMLLSGMIVMQLLFRSS